MAEPDLSVEPLTFDPQSLAAAVGGDLLLAGRHAIRGGAVDSRRVAPGNVFFALPGERTDGHQFLEAAVRNGAAALVVSRPPASLSELTDVSLIRVGDALEALHRAAAAWRARFSPLVVGVTGSLAKTSTKEQTAEVLAERWRVLRNTANENNEIGLPLTLLRMSAADEVAVLEMGMYEPGDVGLLAALARPSIGVVTAVRGTHLERAGSIEAIERGKRELVEALPSGGTAVLNADDERVARMANHAPGGVDVMTYGFVEQADVHADDVESMGADGMRFRLITPHGPAEAMTPALGRHSVHNALAAAAVGIAAGLDLDTLVRGLTRRFDVPHRSALLRAGDWLILDDSYNAGPDSMRAALDLLASLPGRHVAVLGEMLELGDQRASAHQDVGQHAARVADLVALVGPETADYERGARAGRATVIAFSDRDEAARQVPALLQAGDTVLVKASRGVALDLLVDALVDMGRKAATR